MYLKLKHFLTGGCPVNFWGTVPSRWPNEPLTSVRKVEWLQLDVLLPSHAKRTPRKPVGSAWALVRDLVRIPSSRETNQIVPYVWGECFSYHTWQSQGMNRFFGRALEGVDNHAITGLFAEADPKVTL